MKLQKTLLGMACMSALAAGAAQADYPNRDIRVIVPAAAGGGTDAIVRKITNLAEESMPVSMYVENVAGGMTATGLLQLMDARPDGQTIAAITYDSIITIPWKDMLPGFGMDRMRMIARITQEADAITVAEDAPYQSLGDMIAAAKENPGSIRIGIQNMGARTHLTLLQLQDQTGAEFKIVSYDNSAATQKEALLNGEVDAVVTSLGDLAPLIESGQARGLVEFSDTQNEGFPNVPPVTETDTGLDLQMGSFITLVAPARTPDDVIDKLETTYHEAYETDEFQQWLTQIGVTPAWLGSEDVTEWSRDTQQQLFNTMDNLVEKGVLEK
ncbi:Bug family tripartite tricarboxylate transporter substrate binding protein [Halomonas elongata]|uniref:TTT family transporter substrate-binding protein n=1 Tax=Halomonas elongata (strain ATCC 33173 / DSM 2581 / NBRC 15536 / NCIMB 2198 / 1H9) TaxID=768066 RepID=E1V605_HALED|nr:tripartite tricarboxylate transporter substrate binding protein [Halomonas elongata]MDL4861188.1 tripartite tricarboxylate transporter substrate binding protein [Halomonas elongata]RAW07618.1 tripartite tricarboxylate transporter substrate binding protein [Halomonas elongata]WBF16917.1 tripartite tricarboxylate transporter substrate binding protein [Halomonas elongata]WPU45748.1 tripartite tricarboxylate transporter substrate binding protein [Halomonas elongata DSM 2581]CBV43175.1 TTT famil